MDVTVIINPRNISFHIITATIKTYIGFKVYALLPRGEHSTFKFHQHGLLGLLLFLSVNHIYLYIHTYLHICMYCDVHYSDVQRKCINHIDHKNIISHSNIITLL